MIRVSLDPGRAAGVALWNDAELLDVTLIKASTEKMAEAQRAADQAWRIWEWATGTRAAPYIVVVEWPQVYQGAKQGGDPNDLLPLAGLDAALATCFRGSTIAEYRPRDWKGQVPKDVMAGRIRGRLSITEQAIFDRALGKLPKSLQHNAIDAVGIGLKHGLRL